MSYSKHRSQTDCHDLRKNMKIKYRLSQVLQQDQNDPKILQMQIGPENRPNEIPSAQKRRVCSSKKTQQDRTTLSTKIINITLGVDHKTFMRIVIDDETGSLYEALNTFDPVKKERESQAGKEMLVYGIEGIEGYINLAMPLRCIPKGSHMVITFSKTESVEKENNQVFSCFDQSSAECVVFYIHAVGNRKQRILKCRELDKEENKLCVYGFKGETIKTTLRKDGRFQSFVESDDWKLISNNTAIANSQPVDALEGKLFQIEVEKKNSESEDRSFSVLKGYVVDKYPTLTGERDIMRAYIKEQSENSKKRSVFKSHRRKFRKLTKNSIPGEEMKLISQFIASVGLLIWNNNGNMGSATCFVFRGLYIFTCRHVLNDIVGEGLEPFKCPYLISQSVRVTFDYEDYKELTSNFNSYFCIEPWFEISDVTLDYCVLKLKENGQPVPAGLYNGIAIALSSELAYMIGYRNGQKKFIDACTVIPQSKQRKKNQQCVQGTVTTGHSHTLKYLHMYTQRSFQKKIDNPNGIINNTFYCGSSGSPVFDCKGSLVAMHTAGFDCEYKNGSYNIIEFGTRMEPILADIQQKHGIWYDEVCVNVEDVEMHVIEF